jgi:prepilin signal peptidase PulO-like enzyme (type II secretory pathway)
VNSTKKKKQSSIKLALCMTSFVHCNIRRFSTFQNLVLSFSYCPLIHLEKLPNEPIVSLSPSFGVGVGNRRLMIMIIP